MMRHFYTSSAVVAAALMLGAQVTANDICPAQGKPGISRVKLPDHQAPKPLQLDPADLQEDGQPIPTIINTPPFGSVDTAPTAHPEAYKAFIAQLDELVKTNSYYFFKPLAIVLQTTGDELSADQWMKQAAKEGNLAAMQFLANKRLSYVKIGEQQAQDVKEAYRMARQAADAGYAPAVINVSSCLHNGVGVEKDTKEAANYLAQACRDGDFRLRYQWLLITGRLDSSDDKDRPEVKSEIERGNYFVAYHIGSKCLSRSERLEWLRKSADMGSDLAIYELSRLLSAKDPKSSLALLHTAVKQNNLEAYFTLGSALLTEEGNPVLEQAGLKRNEKAGSYLLRLAAMHGHTQAQFIVANMYLLGELGMPKNEPHAFTLFCECRDHGNAAAACLTAYCMLTGKGTTQNIEEGMQQLDALVRIGHPLASLIKAYTHYKGIGTKADIDGVSEYCLEATGMNFPEAYVHLAVVYAKGMPGAKPDTARAENYVRMAELSMGKRARVLYERLLKQPEWSPIYL